MLGGCARDPGGSASGTPPYFFTLFPEDCVQPTVVDPSLPEGLHTTPVALFPDSLSLEYSDPSLPEVLHTTPVAPSPDPCMVSAGPGTNPVVDPSLSEVPQTTPVASSLDPCVVSAVPGTNPVVDPSLP